MASPFQHLAFSEEEANRRAEIAKWKEEKAAALLKTLGEQARRNHAKTTAGYREADAVAAHTKYIEEVRAKNKALDQDAARTVCVDV